MSAFASLRIAIVGASRDRAKFGNKAVRAYRDQGATVYPINPSAAEIEGVPAFASVKDIPGEVDQVSFYVPPAVGMRVIEEVAARGIKQAWLNPGSESDELIAKAEALGVEPIVACSIVAVGVRPSEL